MGMRKNQVVIGSIYAVKVSDRIVPVRIETASVHGWQGINLATGRRVHIRSAARLRAAVATCARCGRTWTAHTSGFCRLCRGDSSATSEDRAGLIAHLSSCWNAAKRCGKEEA